MTPKDMMKLARAVCEARDAYEAIPQPGPTGSAPSPAGGNVNPINPELQRLRDAGATLDKLGGFDAMQAALGGFYDDPDKTAAAGIVLKSAWDGIGDWRR